MTRVTRAALNSRLGVAVEEERRLNDVADRKEESNG
jgi:hypothetical protein